MRLKTVINGIKDAGLAPLYLYQGHKVKRDTLRLPEPTGKRFGVMSLPPRDDSASNHPTLSVMIVGDSAAAGVGASTQMEALTGQLLSALPQQRGIHQAFSAIHWSLHATTGHTSFDLLRRLYVLPKPDAPIDVMIISIGVNDTTAGTRPAQWRGHLKEIIAVAKRKFAARHVIFSSVPLMAMMPALPAPLNGYIGNKALCLDNSLKTVCACHDGVYYAQPDVAAYFNQYSLDDPKDHHLLFAKDGFHPSPMAYRFWAQQLAKFIAQLYS